MKTKSLFNSTSWTTVQWIIFIMALVILMFLSIGLKGQTTIFNHSTIDRIANEYVGIKQNRALVIGVIKNGQKNIYVYGETEKGNKVKPDTNSIFELGQMSEVFTTSLLAILEAQGKISSQQEVRDVLKGVVKMPYYQRFICRKIIPNFKPGEDLGLGIAECFPDPYAIPQAIILCDLATHSAGLPQEPPTGFFSGKNPYKDYTLDKLNTYVSNLSPNESYGYEYQYSMTGMAILGEAMSYKMKMSYDALIKEKILDPLGMRYTFITPNAEQEKLFLIGHNSKGNITSHSDYNALTPAAGIRSSATDLLTFLDANLNYTTDLSKALNETHVPHVFSTYNSPKFTVSWGWIQIPLDNNDPKNSKKIIWQCGERGGFSTFMAFVKESKTAVVVLSNTNNSVDDLGQKILKSLENLKDKTAAINLINLNTTKK